MNKEEKRTPWYIWVRRFLFESTCHYCTNIAARNFHPGDKNACFNHFDRASKESWTPFGQSNVPIPGSSAWDYDSRYNSPFQWLLVKLNLKEKGKKTDI